jgi:hypothetical protein
MARPQRALAHTATEGSLPADFASYGALPRVRRRGAAGCAERYRKRSVARNKARAPKTASDCFGCLHPSTKPRTAPSTAHSHRGGFGVTRPCTSAPRASASQNPQNVATQAASTRSARVTGRASQRWTVRDMTAVFSDEAAATILLRRRARTSAGAHHNELQSRISAILAQVTAEAFSIAVLWLTSLAVPALIMLSVDVRARLTIRLCTAICAIAAGWCLVITYAVAARAMALSLASPEQQLAISDRDGGPLAFAAILGWLPALIVVASTWFARRRSLNLCRRRSSV